MTNPPAIIQGGMGVAVSDWRLARAVSSLGQLGVVSGTGIDNVLVRRLQDGDTGGHMRRAIAGFPLPELAAEILTRFFRPEGRRPGEPYRRLPMHTAAGNRLTQAATILGAFVEVRLAREGHDHPVGINLLTKVQLPNLATLYGAMLAGVDVVLMGAGIPRDVPGALDALARHERHALKVDVAGAGKDSAPVMTEFDPSALGAASPAPLKRPSFVPIVSSHSLATMLLKRATGSIEGFVVEGPTAGGHNAPPRGKAPTDAKGQPVYGDRDVPDLSVFRQTGLPFWLAGGTGSPAGLRDARAEGAAGIQVGTLFAYCDESGLQDGLKREVVDQTLAGRTEIRTDPMASPTGFPFKVVSLPETLSDPGTYAGRRRVCDLGYLREAYETPNGTIGYRCASEPVEAYVAKGGAREDTAGRACLCNALMADVGLAQVQKDGAVEPPLVTSGDDLLHLGAFLAEGRRRYCAADVVAYLLGD